MTTTRIRDRGGCPVRRRRRRARGGTLLRGLASLLSIAGAVGLLAACGGADDDEGGTIAFLLPESKTARYESLDRPVFEQAVADACDDCSVIYANANQDPARQQQQAESALTQGAGVLVLDAVDAAAAASIVAAAQDRGVPVIAYDRFLAGADHYVSFDSMRIGRLQGEALLDALDAEGQTDAGILVVNGAVTDTNAAALREGLRRALEGSGVRVLAEYDTPDWSPDKAQDWVSGQLAVFGRDVAGVYAANDGTAGGAVAAMRAAGLGRVPVTGQDAELTAVQRIVSGDQHMTVYKPFDEQARTAAGLAVSFLEGTEPAVTQTVEGVPAELLEPVAVTRGTIREVLVDAGVYTVAQICVDPYTQACVDAGLLEQEEG